MFLRRSARAPTRVPGARHRRWGPDGYIPIDAAIAQGAVVHTVAGAPACAGTGAAVEAMGDRLEKVTLEGTTSSTVGIKRRNGLDYGQALLRMSGAILATTLAPASSTGLPSGNQRTCLPDAAFNAVKTLEPDAKLSLAKLRTAAVPQLGNVLEASGASVKTILRRILTAEALVPVSW